MEGQVTGEIKKKRSEEILNLSKKLNNEFLKGYIGKKKEVLFESYTNDGFLTGYTTNYMKVKVKGEEKLCGTVQDVYVTSLEKDILLGNLD